MSGQGGHELGSVHWVGVTVMGHSGQVGQVASVIVVDEISGHVTIGQSVVAMVVGVLHSHGDIVVVTSVGSGRIRTRGTSDDFGSKEPVGTSLACQKKMKVSIQVIHVTFSLPNFTYGDAPGELPGAIFRAL